MYLNMWILIHHTVNYELMADMYLSRLLPLIYCERGLIMKMSKSRQVVNLEWLIDKIESGTSQLYPDGNPILIAEYKERIRKLQEYDDWIFYRNQPARLLKQLYVTDDEIELLINGLKWTLDQETEYQSIEEKMNQKLIERLKQLL